ncbi:MAG: hypothetical protein INQ03_08060 [Candidatus Heimdallarchaeota archaeon]|nr:hypothetical protein [Candidatus Heimdallarchaeota archaeon]
MKRKWMDFMSIDVALTPGELIEQLKMIPTVKITDTFSDFITGEVHIDFKFEGFDFSIHNPYSGAYGYWIFYKIKKHDDIINKKLQILLVEIEKQYPVK